jgi:hypothetical protein
MKVLRDFINSFDFVKMQPLPSVVTNKAFSGVTSRVLAEPGKAYAIYLASGGDKPAPRQAVIGLELAAGTYRAEWVEPLTGAIGRRETVKSKKGLVVLTSPPYRDDIALKLIKK